MAEANLNSAAQVVTLKPAKGWLGIDLKELWHYRELIYFLTWRDIKVRYKQAVLGIAWSVLQPVLTTAIMTVVFGILLKVESDGLPYPVFALSALLPWHLFQLSLQKSSISLVGNANLLTKVYFPRVIIPLSSVLAALVDFFISLVLLFITMAIYKIPLTWNVLWVIPLTLLTVLAALAVGFWLSALNVQYRDVQQMVPFLIQIWMYATPIVYPITTIPEGTFRYIYSLNPMVGVVQGFRWAFFGGSPPDMTLLISSLAVLVLLVSGFVLFPTHGKNFCGCGVMLDSDLSILVQGIGKRYKIGATQQRTDTLRDLITAQAARIGSSLRGKTTVRMKRITSGLYGTSTLRSNAGKPWASSGATAPARALCLRCSRA